MPYYIKKKDLEMLEQIKEIAERNLQEEDREVFSSFCEFIAVSKTHKSKSDEHTRAYRDTPEGREKSREATLKAVRKYREKLKNK